MSAKVFISHSSKDVEVAGAICTALENRGIPCWIASRDIGPGENFQEAIVKAIRAAKVMILVFTENANNSDEIKKEVVLSSQSNLVVIPVRAEKVAPNAALAYEFATRQWVDLFKDWEHEIEHLSSSIAQILSGEPTSSQNAGLQDHPSAVPLSADAAAPSHHEVTDKPTSLLSTNPVHHFIGAFLFAAAAFVLVFGISQLEDVKDAIQYTPALTHPEGLRSCEILTGSEDTGCRPETLSGWEFLLIAFGLAVLVAAGLGTRRYRGWARFLGMGACTAGLVISAYLALTYAVAIYSAAVNGHEQLIEIAGQQIKGCKSIDDCLNRNLIDFLLAVATSSVGFAIAFAVAIVCYIFLWQEHPSPTEPRRAAITRLCRSAAVFVTFALVLLTLIVTSMYLFRDSSVQLSRPIVSRNPIDQIHLLHLGENLHGNPELWSGVLLAVAILVFAYAYKGFRQVFGIAANNKGGLQTFYKRSA